MDNNDAEAIAAKMKEFFGERVVDPDVFPLQFKFQVMVAAWKLRTMKEQTNEE